MILSSGIHLLTAQWKVYFRSKLETNYKYQKSKHPPPSKTWVGDALLYTNMLSVSHFFLT